MHSLPQDIVQAVRRMRAERDQLRLQTRALKEELAEARSASVALAELRKEVRGADLVRCCAAGIKSLGTLTKAPPANNCCYGAPLPPSLPVIQKWHRTAYEVFLESHARLLSVNWQGICNMEVLIMALMTKGPLISSYDHTWDLNPGSIPSRDNPTMHMPSHIAVAGRSLMSCCRWTRWASPHASWRTWWAARCPAAATRCMRGCR